MTTQQPEALQLAECCEHGYPLSDEAIRAATELRRLHAYCQELESHVILDCMTHVQNPAEIEHAAGDVSKNGAGLNMSTQHARITELESQLAQRFDAADVATAAAQGFRDGVASAASWISVDERLPEPDGPVLAYNGKWTGVAAWMSGEYLEPLERWQDEHREFIEMMGPAITHWMPLPAAPGPADGESNELC